jgi:hypothetical protein
LDEYLELLDWTGRVLRPDKPGAIAGSLPPILERLGLQEKAWPIRTKPRRRPG